MALHHRDIPAAVRTLDNYSVQDSHHNEGTWGEVASANPARVIEESMRRGKPAYGTWHDTPHSSTLSRPLEFDTTQHDASLYEEASEDSEEEQPKPRPAPRDQEGLSPVDMWVPHNVSHGFVQTPVPPPFFAPGIPSPHGQGEVSPQVAPSPVVYQKGDGGIGTTIAMTNSQLKSAEFMATQLKSHKDPSASAMAFTHELLREITALVDTLKEEGSGNKVSFIMTLLKLTISTSAYQILALTLNLKGTMVHTGADLLQRIRHLLVGSVPVAESDRNKYAGIKFKGTESLQEYASKKLLAGYNCRKNPCDIMEDFIAGITSADYYQHALLLTTAEDYRRQKAQVEMLSMSADYASCFREAAILLSNLWRVSIWLVNGWLLGCILLYLIIYSTLPLIS